jgi:hypothetical protein
MDVDPIAVAIDVAEALERHHIPYVIGGSVASTLYGEPRATLDVDFAVQLDPEGVGPLASSLESDYYVQREAMLEAVERHSVFNLIHQRLMVKVDMHVRPSEGIYAEEIRRARRLKLRVDPDGFADVATPEDTLLQKLRWYHLGDGASDRQWRDVLGILKVMGDELDREYLERWSEELSVQQLLARALEEARDSSG